MALWWQKGRKQLAVFKDTAAGKAIRHTVSKGGFRVKVMEVMYQL